MLASVGFQRRNEERWRRRERGEHRLAPAIPAHPAHHDRLAFVAAAESKMTKKRVRFESFLNLQRRIPNQGTLSKMDHIFPIDSLESSINKLYYNIFLTPQPQRRDFIYE